VLPRSHDDGARREQTSSALTACRAAPSVRASPLSTSRTACLVVAIACGMTLSSWTPRPISSGTHLPRPPARRRPRQERCHQPRVTSRAIPSRRVIGVHVADVRAVVVDPRIRDTGLVSHSAHSDRWYAPNARVASQAITVARPASKPNRDHTIVQSVPADSAWRDATTAQSTGL
jgi:hypothetical protein